MNADDDGWDGEPTVSDLLAENAKLRAEVERLHSCDDEILKNIAAIAAQRDAAEAREAALVACLQELRDACAAAMRVMAGSEYADAWLAECDNIGIKPGFGVRADALLADQPRQEDSIELPVEASEVVPPGEAWLVGRKDNGSGPELKGKIINTGNAEDRAGKEKA